MRSAATHRCRTWSPRYSRIARKTAALFSNCRYTVRLATCAVWAISLMEVLRYPYRVNSSSPASTMAFGLAEYSLAPTFLFLTFFIHIASNRTKYTIIGYLVYLESQEKIKKCFLATLRQQCESRVEESNDTKTFNRFHCIDSVRSL